MASLEQYNSVNLPEPSKSPSLPGMGKGPLSPAALRDVDMQVNAIEATKEEDISARFLRLRPAIGPTPDATGRNTSTSTLGVACHARPSTYFRSRRIKPEEDTEHPWKEKRDPREKWVTIIPLVGLAVGFLLAGYLAFNGLQTVAHHKYKLILDEKWNTFDTAIWTKESNVGGFG